MTNTLRILNLAAQSRLPFEEAVRWFQALPQPNQHTVLTELAMALSRAHPTSAEIADATGRPGLKPTYTPCVLFSRHGSPAGLHHLLKLPVAERERSFRLMLHVFTLADPRRRTTACSEGCTHEWHHLEDLPD